MRPSWLLAALVLFPLRTAGAAAGTTGASFLDIPVGGAPAAMGSAYTAQAHDVYATVWNPAGLGFLRSLEFTGTHLSYLGSVHYEHAGIVIPMAHDDPSEPAQAGFGASMQYLGTGDIDARNISGEPQGSFTSNSAAYSVAYGQRMAENFSLGATAKWITEEIADVSATAYAADLGLLYQAGPKWAVGASVANMGTKIKFVEEADPLPLNGRLGVRYQIDPSMDLSAEGVYRKDGPTSGSFGGEWRYGSSFSFRAGYNTSRVKELGGMAGISAGLGIFLWGQEFSYAWLPVGDLGSSHYFSLVFRMDTQPRPEKPRLRESRGDDESMDHLQDVGTKYENIFEFLNESERSAF